jgi:hypothetical protein
MDLTCDPGDVACAERAQPDAGQGDVVAPPRDSGQPETDSVVDAKVDSNGEWQSDPCPTKTPAANCSTTCGGPAGCDLVRCQSLPEPYTPRLFINDERVLPLVIRTPDSPAADPECARLCGGSASRFSIGLAVAAVVVDHYRVTVPPPWRIVEAERPNSYCPKPGGRDFGACRVVHRENTLLLVVTDDPKAPARNIRVEKVADNATCP